MARHRYAVVSSGLIGRTGLFVSSAAEFESLVSGLDAITDIGPVTKVDALADVMATVHGTAAETDRPLETLGYDVHDLDDDRLTGCYLAQLVVRGGIDRAEGHELREDLPPTTADFDRRKRAALRSDYGERGADWRRLLDDTRR